MRMQQTSFRLATVAACFLCVLSAITAQEDLLPYFQLDSTPTDLQVSPSFEEDDSIVVSTGHKLYLLNLDFSLISSIDTRDAQGIRRISVSYNSTDFILACKEAYCTYYDVNWLDEDFYTLPKQVGSGANNVPLSVDPTGFYLANVFTHPSVSTMSITQIDDHAIDQRSYDEAVRNIYNRQFLHSFQLGEYVYFIVKDNGTESQNNVRIMRLCHDLDMTVFDAAYEAVLECSPVSPTSKVEVSHNLLDEFGNAVITFAVTTDHKTNVCLFLLSDIDSEMDRSYSICSSGNNNTLEIPLAWHNGGTCATFSRTVRGMCEFNMGNHLDSVPALAAFNPVVGRHLIKYNNSEDVTAIISVGVGFKTTTDLIFVALTENHTDHFLDKYHITNEGEARFISRERQDLPIAFLRWNYFMQELYGANTNSVFGVSLERCSDHTSCNECTLSGDPLCGWCTLEQYCSQSMDCPSYSHTGHWVNASDQCITSISLLQTSMAVDHIQSVPIAVTPRMARLPSSPKNNYRCNFYRENSSYSISSPFSNGACQLQLAQVDVFEGPHIGLNFTLRLNGSEAEIFPSSSSALDLHNCSVHSECTECVEASESCGWCIHDRLCTGDPSKCRHTDDWRSLTNSQENGVCPTVITPDHGSYTLPVTVAREIVLQTINLPPEVAGFGYGCQLRYGNGSVLTLDAGYHNHTAFSCLTTENQVHMSKDVSNGSETTSIEILQLRSSDNSSVVLHLAKLTLYNCAQLGEDCSSCQYANSGTGFQCLWCDKLNMADSCEVVDHCKIESTVIGDVESCPLPTVIWISPVTGPTLGGTELRVAGTNLGAVSNDVTIELVKKENQQVVERVPCTVTSYVQGKEVVCITSEASEGPHEVSVSIKRGDIKTQPLAPPPVFTYSHPIINSIEPQLGPKAGGTLLTFQGSNLDISDPTQTTAYIGDTPCDIQSVTSNTILCVSRQVPSSSPHQRTRIVIDNADMPSELFNYTENPVFSSVEPQNTIPAGGVTLTFSGQYLNVVVNPELIVTFNNHTFISACTPRSPSILKCQAPELHVETPETGNPGRTVPRSVVTETIDYTVTMDGAEGPDSDGEELQIVVEPDPVFEMLHTDDREYTPGSGRYIRILGVNVGSVLPSELSVIVDDRAPCILVDNGVSDSLITCFPPDTVKLGDRLVRVNVGSSLNYTVGYLRYTEASSGSNNDFLLVIIPALIGVIILILTVLAVVCCSFAIFVRRKRAYKAKQRSTALHEEDKSDIGLVHVYPPKMYNGNRHAGEHDYDTIPDVMEQMQLHQHMEMITCATQHGLPRKTAKQSAGNIYYSEDEGRGSSASSGSTRTRSVSSSSRPTSGSLSGNSRPLSVSTTGSTSNKNCKRPPLPPLPTSVSDEYVAMHSYPSGHRYPTELQETPTPTEDEDNKGQFQTPIVMIHDPQSPQKVEQFDAGYDKLGPVEQFDAGYDKLGPNKVEEKKNVASSKDRPIKENKDQQREKTETEIIVLHDHTDDTTA